MMKKHLWLVLIIFVLNPFFVGSVSKAYEPVIIPTNTTAEEHYWVPLGDWVRNQSVPTGFVGNANLSDLVYSDATSSELDNITPSYNIVTIPTSISTNPGTKNLTVDIYISGFGAIKNNKLNVFVPSGLLNSEKPGIKVGTIGCMMGKFINIPLFMDERITLPLNMKFTIPPCAFMHYREDAYEYVAPFVISETNNMGKAPAYLILNIADDAPIGDNDVDLIFTYTDGIKWYQDVEKIKIHVNNPVEQYRTYLLIILAILAVPWFSDYTKDKYKKLSSSRSWLFVVVEIFRYILICIVFILVYKSL